MSGLRGRRRNVSVANCGERVRLSLVVVVFPPADYRLSRKVGSAPQSQHSSEDSWKFKVGRDFNQLFAVSPPGSVNSSVPENLIPKVASF